MRASVRCLHGTAVALAALALLAGSAQAKKRPARPVTLEWVGDIALSAQRGLPSGGLLHALAPVRRILRGADITAGNLEGTLSSAPATKCGGLSGGSCYAFQAPPYLAGQLRGLGFGLMNMANNHSLDAGYAGRAQTIAALHRAGIAQTGLPGQITIVRAHGVRVAFLGFAPYASDANLLDIPAARALVRRARRRAAIVVVIIHAGAEGANQLHTPYGEEHYLGEDRGDPRAFARAVLDAGASLVVGSGPHVIRGVERYRGRLVAYSLGNFVGYHTLADGGVLADSGILRVTLSARGGLLRARWISIRLDGGLPRPDPTNASARLVARLSAEDFPRHHFAMEGGGRLRV